MSILVTGSVAIDHIMVFDDQFKNHILADQLEGLNVAFLVPQMVKSWGGTGANIAYNLRVLEQDPNLLAAVGSDLGEYADWLDEKGIRRDWLLTLQDSFTAQAFLTTDLDHNQLIMFHPGAMDRAHEARLDTVEEVLSVGIVSPNGKQAMLDLASGLKKRGTPCVIDPGQGLPMFDGDELLEMVDGAAVFIVNAYEWALAQEKTGLSEEAMAERVGALVVTQGAEGSRLIRGGQVGGLTVEEARTEVQAVKPEAVVDPTGCGDAYRSGLLFAMAHGLPLETGARLGSLMGSLKVAHRGPQSIEATSAEVHGRFEKEFGYVLG
ncbi:MAG: carbohydrate kinase family protein [Myxococcota bacterium]|nr:carbohydrate kinase family protein [Myxococcota bacterium]